MKWDIDVATFAQHWCDKLKNEDKMEHSKGSGFGENLFWASGDSSSVDAGKSAVKLWYDEIKDYDYYHPEFSGKTGHFTQVVWRSSTKVGCGIAIKGKSTWVCCNYSPPGNFIGQYGANVFRPTNQ
ncbi:uncharacterized protein LOC134817371 [Bolinopsis microptera]|uniref:uncharacterized protein LOC134817371 n=1 Tax=Bolinopsis microptera TaxID=2820187 RepID=UPI00307A2DF2